MPSSTAVTTLYVNDRNNHTRGKRGGNISYEIQIFNDSTVSIQAYKNGEPEGTPKQLTGDETQILRNVEYSDNPQGPFFVETSDTNANKQHSLRGHHTNLVIYGSGDIINTPYIYDSGNLPNPEDYQCIIAAGTPCLDQPKPLAPDFQIDITNELAQKPQANRRRVKGSTSPEPVTPVPPMVGGSNGSQDSTSSIGRDKMDPDAVRGPGATGKSKQVRQRRTPHPMHTAAAKGTTMFGSSSNSSLNSSKASVEIGFGNDTDTPYSTPKRGGSRQNSDRTPLTGPRGITPAHRVPTGTASAGLDPQAPFSQAVRDQIMQNLCFQAMNADGSLHGNYANADPSNIPATVKKDWTYHRSANIQETPDKISTPTGAVEITKTSIRAHGAHCTADNFANMVKVLQASGLPGKVIRVKTNNLAPEAQVALLETLIAPDQRHRSGYIPKLMDQNGQELNAAQYQAILSQLSDQAVFLLQDNVQAAQQDGMNVPVALRQALAEPSITEKSERHYHASISSDDSDDENDSEDDSDSDEDGADLGAERSLPGPGAR